MSATKQRYAEPTPAKAAEVFDTTPVVQAKVQRVTNVDIDRCAAWVIPMIQEDFSGPGADLVRRWMRTWAIDNQFSFVCTENAVGLAMLVYDPLSPVPVVQEMFLYVRPGRQFKHEGLEIYKHFAGWMRLNHAGRFRFFDSPGAPMDELRKLFPNLQEQKMWYIDNE